MRLKRKKILGGNGRELSSTEATPQPVASPRTGLPSRWVVIDGESAVLFEQFRDDLKHQFRRDDPLAEALVDQLSGVLWRLRRSAGFEAALIGWLSHQQSQLHDEDALTFGDYFFPASRRGLPPRGATPESDLERHHRHLLGRTLEAALIKSDYLGKLGRYEAHLLRQAERLIFELRRPLAFSGLLAELSGLRGQSAA